MAVTIPKNRQPIHPGEMLLEEFLQPMGISQRAFAEHLGWTTTKLSQIIKGKRGLSHLAAFAIADAFQMEAQFWINLQTAYDIWEARKLHKKVPPLKKVS